MMEIVVRVAEAKHTNGKVGAARVEVGILVDTSSGYDTKRLEQLRSDIEDRLNIGIAEAIEGGEK